MGTGTLSVGLLGIGLLGIGMFAVHGAILLPITPEVQSFLGYPAAALMVAWRPEDWLVEEGRLVAPLHRPAAE